MLWERLTSRLTLLNYFLTVGMKPYRDGLRDRTNTEEDFFFSGLVKKKIID